jgi:hypothetical protein
MSSGNNGQGFGHVPAYQSSGLPWMTGSLAVDTTPRKISFPKVTKWIKVRARDQVRIGFTFNGVTGSNYYTIPSGTVDTFDIRTCEVYFLAPTATTIDVFAGLTLIDKRDAPAFLTGSVDPSTAPGSNWQGVG